MNYEDLLVEKKDGIAIVTLNAPTKLNALTLAMRVSIPLAADEISRDDSIRVAIVTGAGRGFCSGADVTVQASRVAGTIETSRYTLLEDVGGAIPFAFPRMTKPVIAAINGACVGAGMSVALSCDIRIASETARFNVAQIARALVPDMGLTFFLPHAIGTSNAMKLMLTADFIGAAEAEKLGLVSQVVPPDKLMDAACELAGKIMKNAPIAVELTKKIMWRGLLARLNHQIDLETGAIQICRRSEDHGEAVRSFFEKRPPVWKGK
ncbi:MAG: enoyl-CoA hydratase/isomerase family protein [Chloroflexota bacterium]